MIFIINNLNNILEYNIVVITFKTIYLNSTINITIVVVSQIFWEYFIFPKDYFWVDARVWCCPSEFW